MKSKKSLDKLLNSTRQYHARALLEPNEFMSLFNDTLSELQITKKIDTKRLEDEIHNYLNILDWFGHVSIKITQNFFDKGLDIAVIDKDGSKAQHKTHSDEFVNYIITEHIKERHKKKFGSSMPELHSHQGVKLSDIQGDWHTVTQDNGITLTVETVVSSFIEYERSYLSQLASKGTLAALQNIKKIFSNVSYSNPTEAIIIQILEQCTELYLMQYEISSTLLPFHLGDEGISSNVDKIYEIYSTGKDQMVRKIMGMISTIEQQSTSEGDEQIAKELERLADDVITESIVDEWEHPEEKLNLQEIAEKFKSKSTKPVRVPKKQKTVDPIRTGVEEVEPPKEVDVPETETIIEPPKKIEALDAVKSETQSVKITKDPVPAPVENEDTTTALSVENILDKYCAEKISEAEYRVVGSFYIMKEDGQYSLYKRITGKKDEVEDKLICRSPFFVIAKTHHIENDITGVRIASVNEIQGDKFLSFNLGAIEGASFKKELNNKGYKVSDIKMLTEYIHLLDEKPDIPLVTISDKIGWIEHSDDQFGFVLPSGRGMGISGLEYSGINPSLKKAIQEKGNIEQWLTIFDKLNLEKADTRIQFLLFSSLLPLFADFHSSFEGFLFHIMPDTARSSSTSSNGKTSLQRLILSFQGNTTDWFPSWNISLQGIEKYLHSGISVFLDDTKNAQGLSKKEFEDIIYAIVNPRSRATGTKDSRTRKVVLFSSGEKSLLEHMPDDGAYVRYVDVSITADDYGIKSDQEIMNLFGNIHKTIDGNFGFVYPAAIRYMIDNRQEIIDRGDQYINEFSSKGKYVNASRLARRYGLIVVCGEIFIEIMRQLTGNQELYNKLDPYQISLDMFKMHDERLCKIDEAEQESSDSSLDDFINQFKPNEDGDLVDNNGKKLGYIKGDQVRIIRNEDVIADYLPKDVSALELQKIAESSGRFISVKSNNFTRKSIPGKKQYRYFVFSKNT